MQDSKLLATRCTNAACAEQRLWLPPRCELPRLLAPHGVGRGAAGRPRLHLLDRFATPARRSSCAGRHAASFGVELEGVCTEAHELDWKDGTPEFGLPVRAVFNTTRPTNTILDLAWGAA
jgi:hypothetical protein